MEDNDASSETLVSNPAPQIGLIHDLHGLIMSVRLVQLHITAYC